MTAPVLSTPQRLVTALEGLVASIPAPLGKQVDALSELFRGFTADRAGLGRKSYLDDPRLRAAYLRYHLPLNVARATWVLEDLTRLHPGIAALRQVVDLGAGPGSASLATLLSSLTTKPRRYLLTDRSRAALKLARKLFALCGGAEVESFAAGEMRLPRLPAIREPSLVWLSMVLNELGAGRRGATSPHAPLLQALVQAVPPGSLLVVLEPALRAPGRSLLEFHDAALACKAWRVVAPCTHQHRCPLLRLRDRTWCHFRTAWDAPPVVREVADPLRLDHSQASFSYLALERLGKGAIEIPAAIAGDGARVIGDPMRLEGGATGVYVCHQGRREAAQWPGARRGDVLPNYSARHAGSPHSSSPAEKSKSHPSGPASGRPPWKRKASR